MMMEVFINIVIPILSLLLGGGIATFVTIKATQKKANAEATTADTVNSNALIDIQTKYIELIEGKDQKIRELNYKLLESEKRNSILSITHCQKVGCELREPPISLINMVTEKVMEYRKKLENEDSETK